MVCAYDNEGAISFPAALDYVIGVDGSEKLSKVDECTFIDKGIVDIIGKFKNEKVAWLNPDYNIVKGTSFTCCYVTSIICDLVKRNDTKIGEIVWGGKQ